MRSQDLATLIRASQGGDRAARAELVRRFERPVFAYLARMAPNLAEEACQETFLRLFRALPRYRHRDRFQPWLFRLATSALVDAVRARKRGETEALLPDVHVAQDPLPDESVADAQVRRRLAEAVSRLSFDQRQVVALKTQSGLTFREIAEALDCPIGTVLARMHRAIETLRQRMTEERPT
jgi:RNA polymerase sigma-70 factor (ECF subfamily)